MLLFQYSRIALTCLAGFILLTPIGIIGNDYRALVGSVFYFSLTVYFAKVKAGELTTPGIVISALIGQNVLMVGYFVKYFDGELYALPLTASFMLGTIAGGLFSVFSSPFRHLVMAGALICAVWVFVSGWAYTLHKTNFGTFTGKIEPFSLRNTFEIEAENGSKLSIQDFDGKLTVFDFWTSTCGICFEKFPILQNAYLQYQDNSDVVVYAVNVPTDEDFPKSAVTAIRELGYSFPVAKAIEPENSPDLLGVKVYPTTFVINSKLRVVYIGDIEGAVRMVDELRSKDQ